MCWLLALLLLPGVFDGPPSGTSRGARSSTAAVRPPSAQMISSGTVSRLLTVITALRAKRTVPQMAPQAGCHLPGVLELLGCQGVDEKLADEAQV
jgi:hypothetical protein